MRRKVNEHKFNQIEYNKYSERPKHIHQDIFFNPTLKSDFIVSFPSYDHQGGWPFSGPRAQHMNTKSYINFNDGMIAS